MNKQATASSEDIISSKEPILLSFNENAYNAKKEAIEGKLLPPVQGVVDNYNRIEFEEWEGSTKRPLLPGELSRLFSEPVELIFDKMTRGETVAILGMKVNKAEAIKILERPAGYDDLLSSIERCIASLRYDVDNITITLSKVADWFELADSNTVTLVKARLDEISEHYKKYAKTDRAKRMLAFANEVAQAAKDCGIEGEIVNNPDGIGKVISLLFLQPFERQFPKVDGDMVARCNEAEFRL